MVIFAPRAVSRFRVRGALRSPVSPKETHISSAMLAVRPNTSAKVLRENGWFAT